MTAAAAVQRRPTAPLWPMLLAQARAELIMMLRIPQFIIPVVVFPVMFFALFGLPHAHDVEEGVSVGGFLLASFGAYAVMTVALFSFGVRVAVERGQKQTLLMRATPLKPIAYLGGKVVATIIVAIIAVAVLFAFGVLVGGVRLAPMTWIVLIGWLLVGVFPFITLGFAVGYLTGPNSAIGILNLINLPMAFASGLFVPVSELPGFVQRIAPYLPAYHYGQLAWASIGVPAESTGTSLMWITGYTAVFLIVALRAYYREEQKVFG